MNDTHMRSGRFTAWIFLCVALLIPSSIRAAAAAGQVIAAHARFTVITAQLIRLEYSPADRFVDERSWFAINRDARFSGAAIRKDGDALTIDTGHITLVYKDDGRPFSPDNLSAVIRRGDGSVTWHPGLQNAGNLGGTIRTLDQARGPKPLGEGVVSRDGWYLLDDSKSDLFIGDWIASRPRDGNLDWYLFGYGLDYRAALQSLTAVAGPVPLPRKYTLGIWYSRYWSFTADAFKQIVQEYADHGFPLDTMVMDMGWHLNAVPAGVNRAKTKIDTWTGYTWDNALIPDPAGLLKWMHEQGLHVTLNDHPAAGVQPHEQMYPAFMEAMGHDPSSGQTIPFDAGDKKYLDTFWQFTHVPREKEGVDFWWLDWQQFPKTRSIPDLDNLAALNWYYYGKSGAGGLRGQSFSRWAGWGDHRFPIQFSGDADTGFPMLGFEVPFTATAGNVGAFFWSHDIGGHMGGRNPESYARWCQFGALSAALRSHSTHDPATDRRPWNYPDWAEASMRVSFRLRAQLMPYLYTSIHEATAESVPFTRPIYFDHPTFEAAYHQSQEYQFGDNLLVAPIAAAGVGPARMASQAVWFPPGSDWYDYFTCERFQGGESAVATAPIDAFPLYVRGGVALPMQPYTPRPATAKLETLVLRCYPGPEGVTGKSTVYEDDGVTTGYERGESATTPLTYQRRGGVVTITVGPTVGRFSGRPDSRALVIELPCTMSGATCADAPCTYDAASFTTRIELPPASVDVARTVTIRAGEVPAEQITAAAVDSRLKRLLGTAPATSPVDPALAPSVAAARGIAMLPVNQHPYGLGDDVALIYFHNHHSAAESFTLNASGAPSRTISVVPGDAVCRSQAMAAAATADAHPLRTSRRVQIEGVPDPVKSLSEHIPDVVTPAADLAMSAHAEASSGDAAAAIDGSTDGYPGDQHHEWVTNHEKAGAWLKLAWSKPTRMTRILLYDRPNQADHVEEARLEFSDGSHVDVPSLPNDGIQPGTVSFPPKTCTWVKFTVVRAGDRTENIGLSEMAVTDDTKK
jgi:alpha-glucosidase (family GH31 glycosyl hydrolase)